jgi:hypothetical protein
VPGGWWLLPGDPVGRDGARGDARRELRRAVYHRDDPSWLQRLVSGVEDRLGALLSRIASATSHGLLGVLVVLVVLVGVALLIWRLVGPPPVRDLLSDRTRAERGRSATDERAAAEHSAAQGRWDDAVRHSTRALVRELEDRGVLDPRPGRTTAGIAAETLRLVPQVAGDADVVLGAFEQVWYAQRPATQQLWELSRAAEQRVASARMTVRA